jgi:hypothetical protein
MTGPKNIPRCSRFAVKDFDEHLSPNDKARFFSWVDRLESSLRRYPECSSRRFLELFDSIPITTKNTYLPATCFSFLLDRFDGPQAPDILRCYLKIWHTLPEAGKSTLSPEGARPVDNLHKQVQKSVGPLLSLFPNQQTPALITVDGGKAITHDLLRSLIYNFRLPIHV